MDLHRLIDRGGSPRPWSEGDNIPWHDPDFSRRMLREHLRQDHDMASRAFSKVDAHVAWINHEMLSGTPTGILDLGCGPGLYANRLAKLGHECLGIDYSPASISYAEREAAARKSGATFLQQDIRMADYGSGYGMALLIFGELNVFMPSDARQVLTKIRAALCPGGRLMIEVHTFDAVREIGQAQSSWYSSDGGLFSDGPHVVLQESFWEAAARTATRRYFVIDAHTAQVTRHSQSFQAYTGEEYEGLLRDCGYEGVQFLPSLTGDAADEQEGLTVITAKRKA